LGLIGFVLAEGEGAVLLIMLCHIKSYVHLSLQEIGFVLHNLKSVSQNRFYCGRRGKGAVAAGGRDEELQALQLNENPRSKWLKRRIFLYK
jgi:hypothetical protein